MIEFVRGLTSEHELGLSAVLGSCINDITDASRKLNEGLQGLKAISAGVTWRRADGATVDISASTKLTGAASIGIAAGDAWPTDAPTWLLENQAV